MLLFVLLLAVAPVVLLMMLCCSARRRGSTIRSSLTSCSTSSWSSSSSSSSVPSKNSCHHHRRHATVTINHCNSCLMRETTAQIAASRTGQGWGTIGHVGGVRHAQPAGAGVGYHRQGGRGWVRDPKACIRNALRLPQTRASSSSFIDFAL